MPSRNLDRAASLMAFLHDDGASHRVVGLSAVVAAVDEVLAGFREDEFVLDERAGREAVHHASGPDVDREAVG